MSSYKIGKKKADHIYYDVNFTNSSNKIIPIQLDQSRNEAIINNPSNYYVSVVRFTIPNKTIPIFIYPNDGTNADDTQFSVTIEVQTGSGTEFYKENLVFYQTAFIDGYEKFGIYSYSSFINMVNTALYSAWLQFTNFTPSSYTQPYFRYEPSSNGLMSLTITSNSGGDPSVQSIKIYMNHTLQTQYFQNFTGFYLDLNNIDGKDFLFGSISRVPTISGGLRTDVIFQEVSSMASWNGIRALIIQSSKLPTRQDLLNGSSENTDNTTSNIRQLITDFEPLGSGQDSRSRYQYYPQGEYRLLDLISEQPITDLDIRVLWEDKFQVLHQVFLDIGSFMSIKIMFISKDFYQKSNIENIEYKVDEKKSLDKLIEFNKIISKDNKK